MQLQPIDPSTTPAAVGGCAQGIEVIDTRRLLFISGQIPEDRTGHVPQTFEEQAKLVWSNIIGILSEAGMKVENLVKVTMFLSDRQHRDANADIRKQMWGNHRPALTVIITGICDPDWLLKIEAVAAD